jgi:hypothetical protein
MKKLAWLKGLTVSLSVLFAPSVSLVHAGPIKFGGGGDFTGATPFTGNVTITAADPALIFDVETATDTDFWIGVTEDAGSDDDDVFQIGDGTTPGTNPFLTVDTSGQVGIGIAAPTNLLHVEGVATGANQYSIGVTAVGRTVGVYANATALNGASSLMGLQSQVVMNNVSVTTSAMGASSMPIGSIDDGGTYSTPTLIGYQSGSGAEVFDSTGTFTATNIVQLELNYYYYTDSGGTINVDNNYGLRLDNEDITGSNINITNNYGIYLQNQTAGVTNYALYSAGGQSYHAGNFGIGETTPARPLHIAGAMRQTPQASPPSSPAAGDMYVDTANGATLCLYDGAAWQTATSTLDSDCA